MAPVPWKGRNDALIASAPRGLFSRVFHTIRTHMLFELMRSVSRPRGFRLTGSAGKAVDWENHAASSGTAIQVVMEINAKPSKNRLQPSRVWPR